MNQTLTLHDRSPKKKTRGDTGRNRHKRPVSNETTYLNFSSWSTNRNISSRDGLIPKFKTIFWNAFESDAKWKY